MKEINFKEQGCRYTLLTGLNFYSLHFNAADSKKWALEWVKINLPEEYDRIKNEDENKFSNRGFVCRMLKNGLQLADKQVEQLLSFFKTMVVKPAIKESNPEKKKPVVDKVNGIIYQVEDVIDCILTDTTPPMVEVTNDKKQLQEAKAWIDKEIIYAHEQLEKYKRILDKLEDVSNRCGGTKQKAATPTKQKPVDLTAEKSKAAKTMTVMKRDSETGLESLSPARVVGSKEALIYNTKYRVLSKIRALPNQVLMVNGSSIKNIDEEHSFSKKLRKPKEFFAIKDLWGGLDEVKTTSYPVGGRVSSESIIVEVR